MNKFKVYHRLFISFLWEGRTTEQEKESYANELESLAMSPSKKTKHLVLVW
jgi:hypothetical protein